MLQCLTAMFNCNVLPQCFTAMFLQCFFKRNHFYRNTSICMPCYQCSSSLCMPIHYPFIAKIIYRHSICQLDTFIHKRQRIKMVMSTKHPFYNTIIHCSVKKSALGIPKWSSASPILPCLYTTALSPIFIFS